MYGGAKGAVQIIRLNDISDVAITTDAWTSMAAVSYVPAMTYYTTRHLQIKLALLETS